MKCPKCQGNGWTIEHDTGVYSHDEKGNCLEQCNFRKPCKFCKGTGEINKQEEGQLENETQST